MNAADVTFIEFMRRLYDKANDPEEQELLAVWIRSSI
jgi:hypothetical protein